MKTLNQSRILIKNIVTANVGKDRANPQNKNVLSFLISRRGNGTHIAGKEPG